MRLFPKSRRRRVAVVLVLLAYSLLMGLGGCADYFILYPTTGAYRVAGTERREVAVPGRLPVGVWTARSSGAAAREPQAFVLEFVGNASRGEAMADMVAREWGERPVEAWAVNYPGYGGSPGPARLKAIPPAALAAYDALAAKANGKPIFLLGQSLGTAAALHVAAHRPAAGLVLTNPPPLRNLIFFRHGWWNLWLLATPVALSVPSELDSIANAKRSTAPAIFVLAGKDTVVPPKYQAKVFDAYAGPKQAIRVPEADHNDPLGDSELTALAASRGELW